MSKRLSPIQAEVLQLMVEGHTFHYCKGTLPWLKDARGRLRWTKLILRNSTLYALKDRGYITLFDTLATPWWRRDYIITEAGEKALAELSPRNEEETG